MGTPPRQTPQLFRLVRHEDVSGVSGEGVVGLGLVSPDGHALMGWTGKQAPFSIQAYESLDDVEQVHGHDGKTEVDVLGELDDFDLVDELTARPFKVLDALHDLRDAARETGRDPWDELERLLERAEGRETGIDLPGLSAACTLRADELLDVDHDQAPPDNPDDQARAGGAP